MHDLLTLLTSPPPRLRRHGVAGLAWIVSEGWLRSSRSSRIYRFWEARTPRRFALRRGSLSPGFGSEGWRRPQRDSNRGLALKGQRVGPATTMGTVVWTAEPTDHSVSVESVEPSARGAPPPQR